MAFGIILLLAVLSYLCSQNKANIGALAPVAMKYFLYKVVCDLLCSGCAELGRHQQKQIGLPKAGGIGLTGCAENPLSCLQVTISTYLVNFVLSLFCSFNFQTFQVWIQLDVCSSRVLTQSSIPWVLFPGESFSSFSSAASNCACVAQGQEHSECSRRDPTESCLSNWIWDVLNASANLRAACSNGEKTSFCAVLLSSFK